jgi:hypothetical protein
MKKNKPTLYRQGDVLFIPIAIIPADVKSRTDKILANGEITGHMHQFQQSACVQVYEDLSQKHQYIDVTQPSVISHEEHLPIEIPIGKYEIRIGRELDLLQQVHQVQD